MEIPLSYLVSAFQTEALSLKTENGNELYSFGKSGARGGSVPPLPSYFLSNLSAKAIFDMLANGSEKMSEQQTALLFHSHGKPIDWVNEVYPLTFRFLAAAGKARAEWPQILYATAVWIDSSFDFHYRFDGVIRDVFKADIYSEVFANKEDLRGKVNTWIQNKTAEIIQDALDSQHIGADTRLILGATLDFKGEWCVPFEDAGVEEFTTWDRQTINMPFMTSKAKQYVKQFPGYKMLSIPYKQHDESHFSMLFYLSDDIERTVDLRDFIGQHESVIQDIDFPENLVEMADLRIPKFTLNVRGPLVTENTLEAFPDMLASTAMISGDGRVCSFLSVNETGTRAAAVTTWFINKKLPVPSGVSTFSAARTSTKKKEEFVANRPFVFFIRDNRFGRMLFSGAILSVNHA